MKKKDDANEEALGPPSSPPTIFLLSPRATNATREQAMKT